MQPSSSRYSRWSPPYFLALIAALFILIGYGSTLQAPTVSPERLPQLGLDPTVPANDDLRLYRQITKRVASGENYYGAVATEHRFNHYPLKPFFVVRLPTLAVASAYAGPFGVRVAAFMLMLVTCLAWLRCLTDEVESKSLRIIGVLSILSYLILLMVEALLSLHELWAGTFMALSFALWRKDNVLPSILVAAVALAIRETTLPYVLLMGTAALYEKRWRETALWGGLVIAFACMMSIHAQTVIAMTKADDLASPGWASESGWATYLMFVKKSSILRMYPMWVTAILVPLAYFGWASRSTRFATMMLLFQAGYALLFMLIGRPDNFYWGLLIVPSLFVGLIFLPAILWDMVTRLRDSLTAKSGFSNQVG